MSANAIDLCTPLTQNYIWIWRAKIWTLTGQKGLKGDDQGCHLCAKAILGFKCTIWWRLDIVPTDSSRDSMPAKFKRSFVCVCQMVTSANLRIELLSLMDDVCLGRLIRKMFHFLNFVGFNVFNLNAKLVSIKSTFTDHPWFWMQCLRWHML